MKLESCGADCSNCPLRDQEDFILPEANRGARIAVVSDHPSEFEIRYNRPLVGPGTKLFSDALGKAKFDRGQIHITMTVCCRPPEDDMGKFLAVIRSKNKKIVKINKERVKNGEEPYALIKNPQECCAPRLERELEQFDQIITLGSWATKAVLHKSASVMSLQRLSAMERRYASYLHCIHHSLPSLPNGRFHLSRTYEKHFDGSSLDLIGKFRLYITTRHRLSLKSS